MDLMTITLRLPIGHCSVQTGHAHPELAQALSEQADLWHTSNLYRVELSNLVFVSNNKAKACFFCNSGAEANEAAIKLAKKYGN